MKPAPEEIFYVTAEIHLDPRDSVSRVSELVAKDGETRSCNRGGASPVWAKIRERRSVTDSKRRWWGGVSQRALDWRIPLCTLTC